ncbi:MAG TPA: 4-alpha-glucanotransferase [Acidimicrobiia bacterium]|nr:4-alpha-glucanotransferase [Acidimicrobiia bacterium]
MTTDDQRALHELATRLGVQVRYHDIWGHEHTASDETLVAIARALGVALERVSDAPAALGALRTLGPGPEAGSPPAEPTQAPVPAPTWGVFVPVYALRSTDDRGTGTLTHLDALAALVARSGARVVATLPILATWPDDASPYAPVSRQAWDEAILDLEHLPGLVHHPEVRDRLPPIRPSSRVVDHPHVAFAVDDAIAHVATAVSDDDEVRRAVDELARRRPDLARYAQFRALADVHGRDWRRWPTIARDAPLTGAEPGAPAAAVFRYLYGQLAVEAQLDALTQRLHDRGQQLALDLPVGCDPCGFDTWWHRGDYAAEMSIGAPPDPFFAEGQDWGLPPLRPDRARRAGDDDALAGALHHHLRYADILRIDHVMGLHRLWWIPAGHDAADGAYVRYPSGASYDTVVRAARAHDAAIIGEDLGTVEPEVRDAMAHRGILGLWELQFDADAPADAELRVPARPVAVGCNTHDMATWAGFWTGADLDEDARLGHAGAGDRERRAEQVERLATRLARATDTTVPATAGAALDAALAFLARSRAAVVIVTLEDLWLELHAQNRPGTTDAQRANWRQRVALTLDELDAHPDVQRRLAILQAARP